MSRDVEKVEFFHSFNVIDVYRGESRSTVFAWTDGTRLTDKKFLLGLRKAIDEAITICDQDRIELIRLPSTEELLAVQRRKESEEREAERVASSRAGYVYFLQGNGLYKIGKTKNLKGRQKWLEIKLPFPVEVACVLKADDCSLLEKAIHHTYRDCRVNGEWFRLTDEQFARFKKHDEFNAYSQGLKA